MPRTHLVGSWDLLDRLLLPFVCALGIQSLGIVSVSRKDGVSEVEAKKCKLRVGVIVSFKPRKYVLNKYV